jgi:hypothetical protein
LSLATLAVVKEYFCLLPLSPLSSSLPHLAAAILLYFTITLKSQKRAGGSWLLLLHLELSLKGAAELSATNRRRMQQMGSDIFRSCPNDFPLFPTAAAVGLTVYTNPMKIKKQKMQPLYINQGKNNSLHKGHFGCSFWVCILLSKRFFMSFS